MQSLIVLTANKLANDDNPGFQASVIQSYEFCSTFVRGRSSSVESSVCYHVTPGFLLRTIQADFNPEPSV